MGATKRPNHRRGRDPIHPWDAIAAWAGWRKGRVAAKTDSEVAEGWGVQRAWVATQRARRGVLRLRRDPRAWSDEDYDFVVRACEAIGRTPGAFAGEAHKRSKEKRR